jgi:hypothetical protein
LIRTGAEQPPRSVPPDRHGAPLIRPDALEAPVSQPTSFLAGRIDDTQLAALGGRGSAPQIAIPPSQLAALQIEARAGFVLSLIDGRSSVDELVDISGLSRSETIRILHGLLKRGVIRRGT